MVPKEKIGVIGLGKMGSPIAHRLLNAGYSLSIYDLVKETGATHAAKGAFFADSPRSVGALSDITITMLPDDLVLEKVTLGENGIFTGAKRGTTLLDMSTVSPEASSKIAEAAKQQGINFLRATVSGSPKFAEAGTLTIFVSGPEELYKRFSSTLNVLGQKVLYVGMREEARYLKLLVNMIIGTTALIVGEALTFGERGALDWDKMLDALGSSVVASPIILYKLQSLKDRDFTATFSVNQMAKDFDLALATGRSEGIPLAMTSIVRQFMGIMKATGRGEMDLWALVHMMEELAGIKK